MRLPRPALILALGLALAGLVSPMAQRAVEAAADPDADPLDAVATTWTIVTWWASQVPLVLLALVMAVSAFGLVLRLAPRRAAMALVPGSLAGLAVPVVLLSSHLSVGPGAWLLLAAALVILWEILLLCSRDAGLLRQILVPVLFGLALIYLWEIVVRGAGIPLVLLPPPSLIAATFAAQTPALIGDFVQTILRSALRGYVMGCGAGFALAVVCDRFPSLGRGLLPYGNLVSAVPMVGIAPVMIMWFGFGWESKAAVVVITTMFPMLVNTLAGLAQSERLQLDLMRSYGAGYWRTLVMLRLPNALPFIFNALKVNSTFALISAIVAEFFGTPIAGMGFRISTEVARMNLSMVWATITVAALTGSVAYGGLALLERSVTSWHPSYRER